MTPDDPQDIIDGFHAGDIGHVEFFELALEAGMSLEQIEAALQQAESE